MPNYGELGTVIGWTIALVVFAIAGVFAARVIRRWSQRDVAAEPFTLQDLRRMLSDGHITSQEFETMRAAILGKFASAAQRRPDARPGAVDEPDAPPPHGE